MSHHEQKDKSAAGQGVHWYVSGRVQGVGFRYHVQDAARRHTVLGDVRNLPDGRVEMRAMGGNLNDFLAEVRRGPYGSRVDDVEAQPLDPAIVFKGFQIRF